MTPPQQPHLWNSPAIQMEGLCFQYPHSRRMIFVDFSWTVQTGDFWVIIGANGSGKTSLIRLLLGLEQPNRGRIAIFGSSQSSGFSPRYTACSQIGYVPQHLHFDRRLPIPVLDVVEGGLLQPSFWYSLRHGLPLKQRHDICMIALAQVGMEAWVKEPFPRLSSGQKQRVLIARALATQSPILILDEPTASVDPRAAQEIVQICQKLRRKHTILFVSHDIGMIPDVCEHILCISPTSPQELTNKPNQGSIAHSHNVASMSREEILLLLYSHWGLPGGDSAAYRPASRP